MNWLLDRWSRILEGFENLEDHMQQPVDDSPAHEPNPLMANKDTKVRFFDEITDSERADAYIVKKHVGAVALGLTLSIGSICHPKLQRPPTRLMVLVT
ncbi:hypothetical protein NLI96_g3950 [Meripilus lineatus]|uniref:Uncharacterized protein n=1 Tax=Meripilus lineatus TaxID=2056292 RepID=A0AAD5YIG8_9APHY|nr:hypothetical protein NLI96_g3950 [Physisporinus lineatus]